MITVISIRIIIKDNNFTVSFDCLGVFCQLLFLFVFIDGVNLTIIEDVFYSDRKTIIEDVFIVT